MWTLLLFLAAPAHADTGCEEDLCPVVADLNLVLAQSPATVDGVVEDHRPVSGKLQRVFDRNREVLLSAQYKLSDEQRVDLTEFYENWLANRARYEAVGRTAGVPPELVAALHWRESNGNFGTYLHQGDPLGRPAVHVPKDIPLFTDWGEAAVHALGLKQHWLGELRIDVGTSNLTALVTLAEVYNGLGYYNAGQPSPYVFAGTDGYSAGKFVSDGRFRRGVVDRQLGVAVMLRYLSDMESLDGDSDPIDAATPTLKRGDETTGVAKLQLLLIEADYLDGDADGSFGGGTKRAVKAAQRDSDLDVDGIVGPATWEALLGEP